MVKIEIHMGIDDEMDDVIALLNEHLTWIEKDFAIGILPMGEIEYGTGMVVYPTEEEVKAQEEAISVDYDYRFKTPIVGGAKICHN